MNIMEPNEPSTVDKMAEWRKKFMEMGADPLIAVGVKPDGSSVIAAVKTIRGEPVDLRQVLTDILLLIREK